MSFNDSVPIRSPGILQTSHLSTQNKLSEEQIPEKCGESTPTEPILDNTQNHEGSKTILGRVADGLSRSRTSHGTVVKNGNGNTTHLANMGYVATCPSSGENKEFGSIGIQGKQITAKIIAETGKTLETLTFSPDLPPAYSNFEESFQKTSSSFPAEIAERKEDMESDEHPSPEVKVGSISNDSTRPNVELATNQPVAGQPDEARNAREKDLVDKFLALDINEQKKLIVNPNQLAELRQSLRNPALQTLPGEKKYLFHQLYSSRSNEIRQLAIECLSSGFDINTPDKYGDTGLHLLAEREGNSLNNTLLQSFLDKGANPALKNEDGYTPLESALNNQRYLNAAMLAIQFPNLKINDTDALTYSIQKLAKADLHDPSDDLQAGAPTALVELLTKFFPDLGENALKAYKEVLNLHEKVKSGSIDYANINEKLRDLNEIDANLAILKERNFPAFESIKNEIDDSTDDIRHKIVQFKTNRIAYHLMMDKLAIPEERSYKSNFAIFTVPALINALSSMEKKETALDKNIEQLNKKMLPLLINSMPFITDSNYSNKVMERAENLTPGESFLVPTGCLQHSTCLLIEKVDDNTFKLTNYNTGLGLSPWHYQSENSNHYQSYYVVDNVPNESVLNQKAWEQVSNFNMNKNMDPIYELLRDTLGKGGQVSPPSKNVEDYEAIQSSGTCSMQCYMALLRHQCMEMVVGSPAEKEAVYKMIKTKMLISYLQDNQPKLNRTIQKHLPSVINKLNAELGMIEISKDKDKFDEAMSQIGAMIEKFGGKPEISNQLTAKSSSTNMERYAALREASTILCRIWLEHPESRLPSEADQSDIFKLALAKFENHKIVMENFKTRIEKLAKTDNQGLKQEVFGILVNTSYEEFAIGEFIKHFGNTLPDDEGNPPKAIQNLLGFMNRSRINNNGKVQRLIDQLAKSEKSELSKSLENYWKKLEFAPANLSFQVAEDIHH